MIAGNFNSAYALDAADGRIDGKYFGNQIGVANPRPMASIARPMGRPIVGRQVHMKPTPVPVPVAVPIQVMQQQQIVERQVQVQVPGPTQYVQGPTQIQYVEVPGPVQYVEVIKEVAGPVQYVEVIKEVPGPVQYVEVIKEVPVPVYVQVPGPERVVTQQVPGPVQYIREPAPTPPPPAPAPVYVEKKSRMASIKKSTKILESYKVNDLKTAVTLSTRDGTDDAEYEGRPIMVVDMGLLRDIYIANGVTTGAELQGFMARPGWAPKPVTKHSERRAKMVFCSREHFDNLEKKSQAQKQSMSPNVSSLLSALNSALPDSAAWKEAFHHLDANSDGAISQEELQDFLRWLAHKNPQYGNLCTPGVAQEVLDAFDEDRNGTLDISEFLWHVELPKHSEPFRFDGCPIELRSVLRDLNGFFGKNMGYLWMVFTSFDEDKSRTLSSFEVENMISMMAMNKPEYAKYRNQAKRLGTEVVNFLDKDNSKSVDFTEFMALCQPRPFR